ncbi:MAG: type II secretion system minor pseudopilin GspK [Pseudomonadales bacterium]|nr:type II secretion system minor pseudopilin GspK [Pseudomonadales bacterium]
MTNLSRGYQGQKGVALISILLVVAIATVLATSLTADQHLVIQRARTFFDQEQVRQYALGGEELARQILREDFEADPQRDHLAEAWAAPEMIFEFEEGEVQLEIEDLQGRLNINQLAGENQLARARFATLFRQLGIDAGFLARIEDWIDEDQSTRQLGAEDYDYLGLDRPYRTGQTMIVDISELRLLLDMDPETWERLAPYVTALPDPSLPININTAPSPVMQAVASGLSPEVAEALVMDRDQRQGYESVDQFLQLPELAGQGISQEGLGVQSAFFRVGVTARYGDRIAYLTSIIQRSRTDGSMRVIYRNAGKKILPRVEESEEEPGSG